MEQFWSFEEFLFLVTAAMLDKGPVLTGTILKGDHRRII
jgi:hypothetical protein